MKPIFLFLLFCMTLCNCNADRIYIMNATGYNTAGTDLSNAIAANGHSVTVNTTSLNALPSGFTSTCVNATTGYDWLCFFGNRDFTGLTTDIKNFIDAGGKVFYQYEVTCCGASSSSVAAILSSITGNTITPNSNPYIAIGSSNGGWEAVNVGCCSITFIGNAYKGLDGLPNKNQLLATGNLNGSNPPVSNCRNYGFLFTTTDFTGTAKKGAIVGFGDVNVWYDGGEPAANGGNKPLNKKVIDYFFPNNSSKCFMLPPGCITKPVGNNSSVAVDLGKDTTICAGNNVRLKVSFPGATYKWQNNSTDSFFVVTQPGTYWVRVTNNCGTGIDTIKVGVGPKPTVKLGNDTSICSGDTLKVFAKAKNVSYLWQDNSKDSFLRIVQAGLYWVRATNGCGNASDTIKVTYGKPPAPHLGNDTVLCQGKDLLLLPGIPNVTYRWQDNSTDTFFYVVKKGTYTVEVSSKCGKGADTIVIDMIPAPAVTLGNDTTLCTGDSLKIKARVKNATYLWQNNSMDSVMVVKQAGGYWVRAVNACGSVSDTLNVKYLNMPRVVLGNDTVLCPGETLMLISDAKDVTHLWQDNSGDTFYNVTKKGTYWVRATNKCGISVDTIHVNYDPLPYVNLGHDTLLCPGAFLQLDMTTPAASYLWNDGSVNPALMVGAAGKYWGRIKVRNCYNSDTVKVDYYPLPSLELGRDTVLCYGDVLKLDARIPDGIYRWQDNSTNPRFVIDSAGIFFVEATYYCGVLRDTVRVKFEDCEKKIYIPNAFTPNSDEGNDKFKVYGINISWVEMIIFNRWGEIILKTSGVDPEWDGFYQGEVCQESVYFYLIKIKGRKAADVTFYKGPVVLLR